MASRIKEDDRIEKAIRSLLKLPENRRCINCNSLGPQYVCSTFCTFVCINCSGIHREFTHRVKSVSMAKFTAEEVSALRAGGNERARQIYFKEWEARRDAYPDASNIFKLRDFIKSVYVDKRYSSESNDKFSQQKPAVTEDYRESKKAIANLFGFRSLHSMDTSEIAKASAVGRSGNESLKFYFDDKKHKHVTHNPKSRVLPKSPIRFEIVDDRFRDDGSVKRYDVWRESRGTSKSLDLTHNKDMSSFTIVRHNKEPLGKNAPPLRVANVEKKKDQVNSQMSASSDKMENPRSLIDDVPVSEASDETVSHSSSEIPASLKTTENPAPNSLEALLFGLSVPSVVPGTNNSELWSNIDSSSRTPAESLTSSVTSLSIAHAQSSHAGSSKPVFPVTPSLATNNQGQLTLDISNSAHGVGSEINHHQQDETVTSMRKALPEDLFTGGFSFTPPQVYGQHHSMGYGMQYYQYPMTMEAFTYTTKPSNPFDLSCDDTAPNQTPQFPSMACVPHVSAPIGFSDSSIPAADSIGLMTSQSPFYTAALSSNSPSFAFMGQQSQVNMSTSFRSQEITEGNAAQTFHQANNEYLSPNPNAYISRGNPFE